MGKMVVWSSTFFPAGRSNFAREFLKRIASLNYAPLYILFVPPLHENPLILAREKVCRKFLENRLNALPILLREVWKGKATLTKELERPLPWVTLLPIPGQRRMLGVLTLCTQRPLGRERKRCLATMLSIEGTMLEQYLSAQEEDLHSHREEVLIRAQELHRGIAQEIAGMSLFAAVLRQHLASCSPKDRESLKFLDAIDAGLKQSTLHVHAMLQKLHEDALKYSSFRENLKELLESQGPVMFRITTQDFVLPLRVRKLFLEIAGEGEEAVFRWSREKSAKVKTGTYRGEAYILFQGDGEAAWDFPFGTWHTQTLQEKMSRTKGRLRVYHGRKGGITIGVMVPAYVW